ncbi:putative Transcriptional regulator [Nitratireductor aquimarinus]|uniref:hypothetical protein n=1 Tax=Nitratireductor aquimarinus TaxID=889300 RepID=UPI003B597C18
MSVLCRMEVSDGIRELKAELTPYCQARRVLEPDHARALQVCCDLLFQAAKHQEIEIARHVRNSAAAWWNITQEIDRPGTNLALFPIIPRPVPTPDPEGAA